MHYIMGLEFKIQRLIDKQHNKPALTAYTYKYIKSLSMSINYGVIWDNTSLDKFINKIKAMGYYGNNSLADTIRGDIEAIKIDLLADIQQLSNQQWEETYGN